MTIIDESKKAVRKTVKGAHSVAKKTKEYLFDDTIKDLNTINKKLVPKGKDNMIEFYSNNEEYGWLSNFHEAWQVINNTSTYVSNEHYYQSQKAKDERVKKWIANAPSPYLAMKAGCSLRKNEMIDNWDEVKVSVMLEGLKAKFTQNDDLKQKLLETGDAELFEDSPTDMFWDVKGKNMLGKLLMQVRDELKEA